MIVNERELEILHKLIGAMDETTASMMKQNIDFFLHPCVSLFIPSSGQCNYALTPSHTHPAYTFIYYFQAVNNFVVEGKYIAYDLLDGKCITAMSPDIPHQELLEDHFQSYIAIAVDKDCFDDTLRQYTSMRPVYKGENFTPHPQLLGLLRCFMLEAGDMSPKNIDLLNHLATGIIHYLVKTVISDTNQTVPLFDRFEIDRAIAYMNSHYSEKITMEELSARVNLSTSHFTKVFKSITGETPIEFLNVIRLKKSKIMLMNSTHSITEIAIECGFNSSSYFSSCFLEKYRMTPSAYRQQFLN